MLENKEISALFHLIDDPDDEVFSTVTDRIISHGRAIIPNLEHLWENSPDENVQGRIELIIHKLHFRDLVEEFTEWKDGTCELLHGSLLVAKYCYPEMIATSALQEIEKIRRNIWLELNSYLTPLEQVNVISGILYSYYKLKGNEVNYEIKEDFLITRSSKIKRGTQLQTEFFTLFFVNCWIFLQKQLIFQSSLSSLILISITNFPTRQNNNLKKLIFL